MGTHSGSRPHWGLVLSALLTSLLIFRLTPVGLHQWTLKGANWAWLAISLLLLYGVWRGSRATSHLLLAFSVLLLVLMVGGAASPWSVQMWAVTGLQLLLIALVVVMARAVAWPPQRRRRPATSAETT